MQLSSTLIRAHLDALEVAVDVVVNSVDVSCLSGSDASSLLDDLVPIQRRITSLMLSCASCGVSGNQHNRDGSRSGSAWAASRLGVSEKQARDSLAVHRKLSDLPDVHRAVSDGLLSLEKASVIARGSDGDVSIARELLNTAPVETVEQVQRRAQQLQQRNRESAESKRSRLRRRQFVSIRRDSEDMVFGQFRLLPDVAASWLLKWEEISCKGSVSSSSTAGQGAVGDDVQDIATSGAYGGGDHTGDTESPLPLPLTAARAEAFSKMISESGGGSGGAKAKSTIAFHVDLDTWRRGWPRGEERCEIAGIGPVPVSVVREAYEDSALRLVITSKNKLIWYSEESNRDRNKPLPESIKRAVKAKAYDMCEKDTCIGLAAQVDHIEPRCNGGGHELENLQGLCEADHHAKTRVDAPWTVPVIYGPKRDGGGPDGVGWRGD